MCTEEMATESPADCFSPPPRPASTETISSCSESTDTGDPPATYKPRRNKAARPAMRLSASHGCSHPSPFSQLLELTPELQEHIAQNLSLRELSSLAVTCRAATPLQSSVINMRIMELRRLIKSAHGSPHADIPPSEMLGTGPDHGRHRELHAHILARLQLQRGVPAPQSSGRAERRRSTLYQPARRGAPRQVVLPDVRRHHACAAGGQRVAERAPRVCRASPPKREPTQEETPSSAVGAQADVPAPASLRWTHASSGHVDVADSEVASLLSSSKARRRWRQFRAVVCEGSVHV